VFFDRESKAHKYTYHGRVAAFVDGVREAGVAV
jgi:ribosomal protein L18